MYKSAAIVTAITLFLQGCASPKVSVSMLMPARYSEATDYRRVAVLPFNGTDGKDMAQKLEAKLVSVRVKGTPWFDVYEREQLDKALRELRLGNSGLVDSTTAARIGRFIGVRGIYMGNVNKLNIHTRSYSEKRRYCAEENKKRKCLRWSETSVLCHSKQASLEFTPKLVDV